MYINNISVTSRNSRPSVLGKAGLLVYFINDGSYIDPYEISAVSLFKASDNFYPSSVIGDNNEINSAYSSLVLANFSNSAALTTDSSFDASNYSAGASGIFKLKTGVYAVVLDPNIAEFVFNLSGETTIENRVSATGDYLDIWTVRRVLGSDLDTVVNNFTLHEDRFFAVTEPLLFRCKSRLDNNYITLGSKVDIKITNDFTIENLNIDRSISNLFKESLVVDPAIEIFKENTARNLPARVTVSSFAQTSSLCDVTGGNTVIFNFDTSMLSTHPELLAGNFGSIHGIYTFRLRFSVLNQVLYSNYMSLQIS